jgi:type IV pilus assembly protein PilB
MITFKDEEQNERIALLRKQELTDAAKRRAQQYGIPFVDLVGMGIDTDALSIIPEETAKKLQVAAFKKLGKDVYVAVNDPTVEGLKSELEKLSDKEFRVGIYITDPQGLEKAWDRYADLTTTAATRSSFLDVSDRALQEITERVKVNADVGTLFKELYQDESNQAVSRLIETIIGGAIATDSSDVHIEPQEKSVHLRLRQDGELQDIVEFDIKTYRRINSRIKILSHLKLTNEAQAQDGRFTIKFKQQKIEIRVSIIPGAYGESIVMRILNPDMISVEMGKLGIEPKLYEILRSEIHKPNGLVITTGPTGSGKTTSLYAFLKEVYDPAIKILTIEDPVEYHLDGITQTQAEPDKGYTFAAGLRGALRQDPDVIMVGEIRDAETAGIAVNASLTGHIVLSTLHTNNAAGAIPRLIDLKVNPKIIPSSLNVAIAQRLVRKLIPECKESYKPDTETEKIIRDILKKAERNGKDLAAYGVSSDQEIILYRPKADCNIGNGTGYKGRIGIFEAILVDSNIETIVAQNPSERDIRLVADKQGILTMQEDGILKALAGVTSLEEVRRVVDIEEYLYDDIISPNPLTNTVNPVPIELVQPPVISSQTTTPSPTPQQPTPPITPSPDKTSSTETPEKLYTSIQNLVSNMNEFMAATKPQEVPDAKQMDEHLQADTTASETLSDHVRDAELIVLVDQLRELELEQEENPSQSAEEKIRRVRELIIDIIKAHPPRPRLSIDADGNVVKSELRLLVKQLLDIENEQKKNPKKGAASDIKKAREEMEKHVGTKK